MADKSPRHSMSQKSSKSIKEKRADKQAKSDAKNSISSSSVVPPTKKR
jgi:hypothetical protein